MVCWQSVHTWELVYSQLPSQYASRMAVRPPPACTHRDAVHVPRESVRMRGLQRGPLGGAPGTESRVVDVGQIEDGQFGQW